MKSALARLCAVLTSAVVLAACAAVDIADYRDQQPRLDLREFFDGRIEGWGMFQDRQGKVLKRFHVRIDARWEGATGTLDERFTWSDGPGNGNPDRRVWTLTDQGDGRYAGTAGDVVGKASGEVAGHALRWRYVLALPVDGRVVDVDFDDWMYLVDDKVMLNRSTMSKFGVRLGDVTLTLIKRDS